MSERDRLPHVTVALTAVLLVMFGVQQLAQGGPNGAGLATDAQTAIALGALDIARVRGGEWWRLVTSAVLHRDIAHLAVNLAGLAIAGAWTERRGGHALVAGTFLTSAIAGAAASVAAVAATGAAPGISLGASAGVVGLAATGAVLGTGAASHRVEAIQRTVLVALALVSLAPALDNAARIGGRLDVIGHAGGVASGALIGATALTVRAARRRSRRR